MTRKHRLLIARLVVFSLLFALPGAGLVGWIGFGRVWLGIGSLLAALVLGALAWYLNRWARMDELERVRWAVLIGLVALAILSLFWSLSPDGDLKGAALNFGTEMLGAVVTYALFELIVERRERRQAEKQAIEDKKAELTTRMGSDEREVAVTAVNELRRRGWLTDGSLRGADLADAKLSRANLENAVLREAHLVGADLEKAYLAGADLRSADLEYGMLQGAVLDETDLRRADLASANLRDVELVAANLRNARVTVEQLARASWMASAILPDGTELGKENWEQEFDSWYEIRCEERAIQEAEKAQRQIRARIDAQAAHEEWRRKQEAGEDD